MYTERRGIKGPKFESYTGGRYQLMMKIKEEQAFTSTRSQQIASCSQTHKFTSPPIFYFNK
jgi:hypothetical protein